jgi:hypothetical protein
MIPAAAPAHMRLTSVPMMNRSVTTPASRSRKRHRDTAPGGDHDPAHDEGGDAKANKTRSVLTRRDEREHGRDLDDADYCHPDDDSSGGDHRVPRTLDHEVSLPGLAVPS